MKQVFIDGVEEFPPSVTINTIAFARRYSNKLQLEPLMRRKLPVNYYRALLYFSTEVQVDFFIDWPFLHVISCILSSP